MSGESEVVDVCKVWAAESCRPVGSETIEAVEASGTLCVIV